MGVSTDCLLPESPVFQLTDVWNPPIQEPWETHPIPLSGVEETTGGEFGVFRASIRTSIRLL